ncbi:MAG: 30S ribosomal protein S6 [Parcubacteria group bacterium GW2011_GWC1_45_14]|nr:MAG: 30S ribosomal protein S6 [Parcubacteria group bacterium GW2011_GWC1_45_14]
MQYELFYLVGQNNEEKLDAIKKEVEQTLTDEGAVFGEMEVITRRKLSYEVKHQIKGIYIARRFEMPEVDYWAEGLESEKVGRIDVITKKLNLNQNVLRFMIVKAEELPELKQKEEIPAKREPERRDRRDSRDRSERPTRHDRPAPAKKEEKKPEESIDKKLEEILNI